VALTARDGTPVAGETDSRLWLSGRGVRERNIMAGFDPDYRDFVDYILRCTHKIWESRGLGLIESHYSPTTTLWTTGGIVTGDRAVIANTAATLAAFPDRALMGEAVVWTGDDSQGWYSSHRILSTQTHLGPSDWGPATGRSALVRTIADCWCVENRIEREWLVRDNLAAVLQLGLDPWAVAAAQGWAPSPEFAGWREAEWQRVMSGHAGPTRGPATEIEAMVADVWQQAWDQRRLDRLAAAYADHVEVHAPGLQRFAGVRALQGFILATLAPMPDARFAIDHVASVPYGAGVDVALRWTLAGTHTGLGLGAATGTRLHLIGCSHARVLNGVIDEEWIVADLLALYRQIEGARS
jgi:predicted ester cyclase